MDILTDRLRDEIQAPSSDNDRLDRCLKAARAYVKSAVGNQESKVSQEILDDCLISCAADLYNSRDARLGVMSIADGVTEPFRVSTDPLRSVWPKLTAAGILTGGQVIA